MAVPARNIGGVIAQHLMAAHDKVLEDLVHRGAEVNGPVRIGRAVMQDEWLGTARLRILPHAIVKAHLVPTLDPFRLSLWKAAAHREVGFWQKERVAVIVARVRRRLVTHCLISLELAVVLVCKGIAPASPDASNRSRSLQSRAANSNRGIHGRFRHHASASSRAFQQCHPSGSKSPAYSS